LRELDQQRLSRIGKRHRAVLAILLRHAYGLRFISMRAKCLGMGCIQATRMQLDYIIKVYPTTMANPKGMGMQQGREALQQRQQNDKNKTFPAWGHGRILNLI
jgi:hypothetical protein